MLTLTSQPACWEEEGEDSGWHGVRHRRKGGGVLVLTVGCFCLFFL